MITRTSFEDLVRFDLEKRKPPIRLIAGVDEAGRGALAGPVVAAAVICEPHADLLRVTDSKLLPESVREELYEMICQRCLDYRVGIIGPEEIDRWNILRATLEAMRCAICSLEMAPCFVLVDGRHVPSVEIHAETVKGGDRKSFSIAAASIVAKVTRDRIMRKRDREFPGYGFRRNKGYGTREHIEAIRRSGLTAFHRRSFHIRSLD